jgi:hypothetical protein
MKTRSRMTRMTLLQKGLDEIDQQSMIGSIFDIQGGQAHVS